MQKLTKIDHYGIGRSWLAMIKLVSERQQCTASYGTGAHSMMLVVLLCADVLTLLVDA